MGGSALSDGVVELRLWTEADADAIADCIDGDAEITRWLDEIPQPYSSADGLAYIRGIGGQAYAVTDAQSLRVLGSIGLRWNDARDVAEVGYWLRNDARGRGVTTRALLLVTKIAFDAGAARVQLRADVANTPSRRVAEKAGFRLEGVLRSAHWSPRQRRRLDWAMYSLLPDEL